MGPQYFFGLVPIRPSMPGVCYVYPVHSELRSGYPTIRMVLLLLGESIGSNGEVA